MGGPSTLPNHDAFSEHGAFNSSFESCEGVFPKPVAHNMFHAMLFENMTDICFHVYMHAYCLTYVWNIDRLR